MIFVTVGLSDIPFDRLVSATEALCESNEDVVVQYGAARVQPRRAIAHAYLPFDRFEQYVTSARVVVCHAGIGSVAPCLSRGIHPIVVPRQKRLGEAVDDHQVSFGRRLSDLATQDGSARTERLS